MDCDLIEKPRVVFYHKLTKLEAHVRAYVCVCVCVLGRDKGNIWQRQARL